MRGGAKRYKGTAKEHKRPFKYIFKLNRNEWFLKI
jgi:hypothetical protein